MLAWEMLVWWDVCRRLVAEELRLSLALALTSWVTLAGQLLSGSNKIMDTEAFLHKHGGCSATQPPRANLTAAPHPEVLTVPRL